MRWLAVGLFVAASCAGPRVHVSHPDLEAQAVRQHTLDISGAEGFVLDLATRAGDIEIEVADGPPRLVATLRLMARTEAEAERLLSRFELVQRVSEGALQVRVEGEPTTIDGTDLRVEPLVSFRALLPPGQGVRAATGSGRVDVHGAVGDCEVQTAFGDITGMGLRGDRVRLKTGSGAVELEDARADSIRVETSFGQVTLTDVRGDLAVDTGSGDVTLRGFAEGRCDLSTGFGDVDAEGSFSDLTAKTSSGRITVGAMPGSRIARPWTLKSSFGDVNLRLPHEFDCDVLAETSFGAVTSAVDVERRGKRSDRRMRGSIGEGGGRVILRTDSGDIRILSN